MSKFKKLCISIDSSNQNELKGVTSEEAAYRIPKLIDIVFNGRNNDCDVSVRKSGRLGLWYRLEPIVEKYIGNEARITMDTAIDD